MSQCSACAAEADGGGVCRAGEGEPAALVVEFRDRLPKGRALDVAMGYGRHALYLAAAGWEVDAVERDPEAVAACRAEARRRGLSINAIEADLGGYRLPVAAHDLLTF